MVKNKFKFYYNHIFYFFIFSCFQIFDQFRIKPNKVFKKSVRFKTLLKKKSL